MSNDDIFLKTSLKQLHKIEPFYMGGQVVLTPDEKQLLCCCGDEVKLLDIATGQVVQTFPGVCVSDAGSKSDFVLGWRTCVGNCCTSCWWQFRVFQSQFTLEAFLVCRAIRACSTT